MKSLLRLPNEVNAPPGGWRYRIPELELPDAQVNAVSLPQLIELVQARYKANRLNAPCAEVLTDRIHEQTCHLNPDYCSETRPVKPGSAFTFETIKQGTRTLLMWFLQGRKKVDHGMANARAATCASCDFNGIPEGCSGCNSEALKSIINTLVGGDITTSNDKIHSCRICGCSLQAKVWLPLETILPNMPLEQQERLPEHCWIVKENPNVSLTA